VQDNRGKPLFIPIIDKLLTIFQIQFEANSANKDNTIAIKTAMTDNSGSRSRNAEPKIQNNGYVTRLYRRIEQNAELCISSG